MANNVSLGNFSKVVEKLLDEYQKDVGEAVENGLDEAQDYMIDQLKAASPKKTGDYANHWKAGTKAPRYRVVKNDKVVKMSRKTYRYVAHDMHLAGILEFSTYHSKPHIYSTLRKCRRKIFGILKSHIENGS